MNIAASGLGAATTLLGSTASNIANMNTSGPLPATPPSQPVPQSPGQVYQATSVQQSSAPGGGVTASEQPVSPSYFVAFDPDSSFANSQGMVAAPNVDPATQFVNLALARTAFAANLAVFKASENSYKSLLDILA